MPETAQGLAGLAPPGIVPRAIIVEQKTGETAILLGLALVAAAIWRHFDRRDRR